MGLVVQNDPVSKEYKAKMVLVIFCGQTQKWQGLSWKDVTKRVEVFLILFFCFTFINPEGINDRSRSNGSCINYYREVERMEDQN